jgi:hypothetical protein
MKRQWWEDLTVEGCGNPEHGPNSPCWKVLDRNRARVIGGVPKRVADFCSAASDMARALLMAVDRKGHAPDCPRGFAGIIPSADPCNERCIAIRSALAKAGVPLP